MKSMFTRGRESAPDGYEALGGGDGQAEFSDLGRAERRAPEGGWDGGGVGQTGTNCHTGSGFQDRTRRAHRSLCSVPAALSFRRLWRRLVVFCLFVSLLAAVLVLVCRRRVTHHPATLEDCFPVLAGSDVSTCGGHVS